MPMKLYEVEITKTRRVTYVVQALDSDEAQEAAWGLLDRDKESRLSEPEWEVTYVGGCEP